MKGLNLCNPGLLNLNALKLVGAGTKRGRSDTIGQFSSGMKNAVALALRHGVPMKLAIGSTVYRFATKTIDIGYDQTSEQVVLISETGKTLELGFTRDLGGIDWTDKPEHGISLYWLLMREILCNAIDAAHEEVITGRNLEARMECRETNGIDARDNCTVFWIGLTPEIQRIWQDIGCYILSLRQTPKIVIAPGVFESDGECGRVFNKNIFVRAYKPGELLWSYAFQDLTLTESRTVEDYHLKNAVATALTQVDDPRLLARIFKQVFHPDNEETVEACLDRWNLYRLSSNTTCIAEAWNQAFGEMTVPVPANGISARLVEVLMAKGYRAQPVPAGWLEQLRKCVRDYKDLIDEDVLQGLEFVPKEELDPVFCRMATDAFQRAFEWFGVERDRPEIRYYRDPGGSVNTLGRCQRLSGWVGLNSEHPPTPMQVQTTALEETAHWVSGASDNTREFQEFVLQSIGKWVTL